MIYIREFLESDAKNAADIWNGVVEDGVAFPQLDKLSEKEAEKFFAEQDFTGIAFDTDTGETVGFISFTRTISEDAAISQMQAMP